MKGVICEILIFVSVLFSCTQQEVLKKEMDLTKSVIQNDDGSIFLHIEKADCYVDINNPVSNTAEWNVSISKKGKYNIWLSSLVRDTATFQYFNSVHINILDDIIETRPNCDKVVFNSADTSFQNFRVESFMGSMNIKDTGFLSVQVISDKIFLVNKQDVRFDTRLLSVTLTPASR